MRLIIVLIFSIFFSLLTVAGSSARYEGNDWFERQPFIAHFKWGAQDFSLIGVHIKPNHARAELSRMDEVYSHSRKKLNEKDSILLGDFNAGCGYLTPFGEYNLDFYQDSRFNWLLDYYADTNVASSQCAYDRIVTTGDIFPSKGKVFKRGIVRGISDHYLVYTKLAQGKKKLLVAAWNIQRFGQKKASRPRVVKTIVKVIRKFDIILIQEILGASDVPMDTLMRELPAYYKMTQSPAIGRSSYKERYAYVYDSRKVKLKSKYVFPDD